MKILNSFQTRELEKKSISKTGSYIELMKNAGMEISRFILKNFKDLKKISIFCGNGNNGGDGFVAAGILINHGIEVNIILVHSEPKTEDAIKMFSMAKNNSEIYVYDYFRDKDKVDKILEESDVIIDAIYGIGFHGAIDSNVSQLIRKISSSGATIISADIPSGIECDNGKVMGEAIKADYTITFNTLKPAHVLYPSMDYCGKVIVADLGIAESIINSSDCIMKTITSDMLKQNIPKRKKSCNKGNFGRLMCVCGSYGMSGATILSSKAAIRCGVGVVNVALSKDIYNIVSSNVIEAVFTVLDQSLKGNIANKEKSELIEKINLSSACLIGCGIGRDIGTVRLIHSLLENVQVPLIIDADGINIISENIDLINEIKVPVIFTPHPVEMARLLGITLSEVQKNRYEIAKNFAKKHQVTIVLKGAHTLVASPDGEVFVNLTGNPGMAKAGSGDVLAGMIASFLAQGMDTKTAAACGVYAHGRAGDIAKEKYSEIGMTPTDIVNEIPSLFLEVF